MNWKFFLKKGWLVVGQWQWVSVDKGKEAMHSSHESKTWKLFTPSFSTLLSHFVLLSLDLLSSYHSPSTKFSSLTMSPINLVTSLLADQAHYEPWSLLQSFPFWTLCSCYNEILDFVPWNYHIVFCFPHIAQAFSFAWYVTFLLKKTISPSFISEVLLVLTIWFKGWSVFTYLHHSNIFRTGSSLNFLHYPWWFFRFFSNFYCCFFFRDRVSLYFPGWSTVWCS